MLARWVEIQGIDHGWGDGYIGSLINIPLILLSKSIPSLSHHQSEPYMYLPLRDRSWGVRRKILLLYRHCQITCQVLLAAMLHLVTWTA